MPPGSVYNWLAVAHSALVILDHALLYRAAQVTRVGIRVPRRRKRGACGGVSENWQEEAKEFEEQVASTADEPLPSRPTYVQPSSLLNANEAWLRQLEIAATPRTSLFETVSERQVRSGATVASTLLKPSSTSTTILATDEAGPAAAEPPTLAADVNLSRLDAPSSQHLSVPESEAPNNDVLIINHLNFLYILKPVLL